MIQKFKKVSYKKIIPVIGLGVIFFLIGYAYASAFVGPTSNPPGGSGGGFFVDASGNIGFGVLSGTPSTNPPDGNFERVFLVGAATNPGVAIRNLSGTGRTYVWYGRNAGQLALWDAAASAVRFQVDTNGRIGIGSSVAPDELLHVFGNVKADGSFVGALSGSISAANVSQGVFGDNFGVANYAFPGALAVGVNSTVGLQSNSLYVNGNVGVGIVSPGARLDVKLNSDTDFLRIQRNSATGRAQLVLATESAVEQWRIGMTGPGDTSFAFFGGTINNLVLERAGNSYFQGGNVGIGTAIPGFKLDVNGTARISGAITLSGDIAFGGAATTNLNMNNRNIVGVNKITVATIDPLYEIAGEKYATYGSSIVGGVREEYVGRGNLQLTTDNQQSVYEYVVDFNNVKEGSDLWVWRNVVDFSRDGVEVLTTPYGVPASIYYEIEGEKIIFRADALLVDNIEFSYRLSGRRFDWKDWPTYAKDQEERPSFMLK